MLPGLLVLLYLHLQPAQPEPGFAPVTVNAAPIAEFLPGSGETRFGLLDFLGGLQLSSANPEFGSLSGIAFLPDAHTFVAAADTGFWFRAALVEDGDRPTGIANAELGPILDAEGRPPTVKARADAEGVRLRPGGDALVTFEGRAALRAFAGPDFAGSVPRDIPLPGFTGDIPRNQGFESVAVAPADGPLGGAIVLIAERSLDDRGNHRGFVLSGPRTGTFFIRRTRDYDVTDATFLPDGDLLILERRFNLRDGFAMRMRRFAADAIRPGATLDGTFLMEADGGFAIDNMEGLAAQPGPDGSAILTLISDDNGSWFQKTRLLQFALRPVAVPMPHIRPR